MPLRPTGPGKGAVETNSQSDSWRTSLWISVGASTALFAILWTRYRRLLLPKLIAEAREDFNTCPELGNGPCVYNSTYWPVANAIISECANCGHVSEVVTEDSATNKMTRWVSRIHRITTSSQSDG